MEHHDRAGRVCFVAGEPGAGHAGGFEAEPVAVEGERSVEVVDRKCDDVDVRLHLLPPVVYGRTIMPP